MKTEQYNELLALAKAKDRELLNDGIENEGGQIEDWFDLLVNFGKVEVGYRPCLNQEAEPSYIIFKKWRDLIDRIQDFGHHIYVSCSHRRFWVTMEYRLEEVGEPRSDDEVFREKLIEKLEELSKKLPTDSELIYAIRCELGKIIDYIKEGQ